MGRYVAFRFGELKEVFVVHLKFYLLGLVTFILSGWELYASLLNGQLGVLHILFLTVGLVGAIFCFLGKFPQMAKRLLTVFYFIQLVFIYSESFSVKFVASFAFPVHYFLRNDSGLQQTFSNPTGLGLNLFALLMLFFVYKIYSGKTAT
ncbi:hypothetical protein H4J55_04675 [Colwellia sp. MB3u-22]|uniref:hypothetical protein n=1 Tax=Colwellia sp. MB3u-22 TaxID=2759813 RepID=UPI0015F5B964|nr:hypothetical protein [Colwellia sp. MB3u-22]MBA6298747.1 hypothetical protein [Colwellia sp. MB3u-22]